MIYVNYLMGMGLGMIIMMNAAVLNPIGILVIVASGMGLSWLLKVMADDCC